MKQKIALVVTTIHRGVFFGYAKPTTNKVIKLEQAQMCVYWSSDIRGVLGLAADGPSGNCKIGPAIPSITLQDVTSVMECSMQAEEKWKVAPWK